jgi:hypothetical protein
MPIVVRSVLLVRRPEPPVGHRPDRCDGCRALLPPSAPAVHVRNRTGPGAVRPARLCDACLAAIDVAVDDAIDLTD